LHPRLGIGWAKVGQRLRIPTTSQHRQRLNVFGWVAPLLGQNGLIRCPQGNREGFVSCLRHLYRRLRRYTIWLYVDRAKWHRGEEVDIFVKTHIRLRLNYLPCYQPGLNLQERVWRQVRYEATTNRWFESLDATWETLQKTVHSWTPNKIKRLCQLH
jgi:transposase